MAVQAHEVTARDGLRLTLHTSGSGRPLLIVPGVATDPRLGWDAVREHLEPHLAVTVMQRRGILGDPLSALTMEQEFEDVAEVAMSLGPEVDVLGHSSGALYAMGAAPLAPNVRRLMLYEPPLETPHAAALRERLETLDAALQAGDIERVFDTWWTVYLEMPREVADAIKASPVGAMMRPLAQYIPREIRAHLDWDVDPAQFAAVEPPTLFIYGTETAPDAPIMGWLPVLKAALPNLTVREIPGQTHFANAAAPDVLAAIVLDFVQAP